MLASRTPRLAVIAYPILSFDERQWLEGIRARHDPQASRIKAHFTLVFPVEVGEEPLLAHVRAVLPSFEPVAVVVRSAVAFQDAPGGGSFVFLLPVEGRAELLAIHERLHDGVLSLHSRRDTPFVPHVTVGASPYQEVCEQIASQINQERRIVHGTINRVDVIEVAGSMVGMVAEIPLGRGGDKPANQALQGGRP